MTLLKELIDIPERVQRGDFVLRLSEGVNRAEETLRDYVVTPELARCFDAALIFIRSAVQGCTSKATYLHGSFGSGKSHFMAVLHLILQGNAAARGIPELAAVIQKHNDWLVGKKFLLVPYHMINSHDMESGILGNYVEFMRRTHPDAPIPPVYMSATIIAQAAAERASYGDEPFFKRLNAGSGGGWGQLSEAWTASSFDAAAAAAPDSESHKKLVSALLKTVATSHADVISHRGGNFVRFDAGLSIISQHAAGLGYDGLILFLDELILWLAMNSADLGFVKREAAKLTNLVEAQSAGRPIPLISFVARQRDLRELVGDHVPGAERLSFSDSLDWQQGRFDTITLEDRNLPAIAEKRVLRCRSEAARAELDAAFDRVARMKDSVMTILLTQEGDRRMFRRVYPFSPALVQTLIAVSSVLQRERTALKVMMQLLVDHREHLRVDDVIPVGDLFDVVAHGDEAFSPDMAIHFDNAKRLYHQKLLPVLERENGVRLEELNQLDWHDARRVKFRNDDRLVKTLLLSALVPEVESLRGLNAEKLAALNHGTIRTPVPGREANEVVRRVRNWVGAGVGEIQIGSQSNPAISVQLSGVDTDRIIEQARREDNQGNRVRRVRQMLFEQMGIVGENEFEQIVEFTWRNTRRECTVLFKNIRELPDSSLQNSSDSWKLVIDFPFDDAGHGPREDLDTLQRFRQGHPQGTKTICWVPSFFSEAAKTDLGLLVVLEHILTGDRFAQYASHLSPQDRQSAKSVLQNQRSVLNQRVQSHLEAAYGMSAMSSGSLDTIHDLELHEHFVSLSPGLTLQPPVGANLAASMQNLLGQSLEHEFPGAPFFETEVRGALLRKVYELILPAAEAAEFRVPVEKSQRLLVRQIAVPLQLADMDVEATHAVLQRHWMNHFARRRADIKGAPTVEQLREWIDDPRPMGLSKEAQNLIILLSAAQSNLRIYRHGGPWESATIQSLPDDCELRAVELPAVERWETALQLASRILGVTGSRLLNAPNLATFAGNIKTRVAEVRGPLQTFHRRLQERLSKLQMTLDASDRMKSATMAVRLLDRLAAADAAGVVDTLCTAEIATSETAMGQCVGSARELTNALDDAGWRLIEMLPGMAAAQQSAAQAILTELRQALCADEHAVALQPAVAVAGARATRLVEQAMTAPVSLPVAPSAPVPAPIPVRGADRVTAAGSRGQEPQLVAETEPSRRTAVLQGEESHLSPAAVRELLTTLEARLRTGQTLQCTIRWSISGEAQQ